MKRSSILTLITIVAGATVLMSCSRTSVRVEAQSDPSVQSEAGVVKRTGPPPHAPAHGYRQKHMGAVLVYESRLGVYAVQEHEGYFFYKQNFYRAHKDGWQISGVLDGPWKNVSSHKVPRGLRKEYDVYAKGKGKKS